MSTLSPTDVLTKRINSLLRQRIDLQKQGNKEAEKQILRDLSTQLAFISGKQIDGKAIDKKDIVKAIPDGNRSFSGKKTGKKNPTTRVATYLRNVNRRLMQLEDTTMKEEKKSDVKKRIQRVEKQQQDNEINANLAELFNEAAATPAPLDAKAEDLKDNKDALLPTTITPTTIAPPPPSLSAMDRKRGNYRPIREYNQLLTRIKKLEITPEDYIKNLDIEQLKALPPRVADDPAFKPIIKERIKKLTKKQQAAERLLYEQELEAQKKIEASKQAFDAHHETDNYEIAPSDLYIRNIDHLNPIMMRQFQFDPPDNIPVQVKNLQEKDTLRRATKIKIYDDEPKTTLAAAAKLEKPMRDRLRKPKVKFEPSTEQRQPLESLAPINRGESGLSQDELYLPEVRERQVLAISNAQY